MGLEARDCKRKEEEKKTINCREISDIRMTVSMTMMLS